MLHSLALCSTPNRCCSSITARALTRTQRAEKANKILETLTGDCKNIFTDVIKKYIEIGISAIEDRNTLRIEPFVSQYGTGVEIVRKIGGNEKYIDITEKLKNAIYGD